MSISSTVSSASLDSATVRTTYLFVVVALNPSHQTETRQDLWLYSQGDVELSCDVVDAKRDASPGPKHHHGRLEANGIVATIVDDDLRDELRPSVRPVLSRWICLRRCGQHVPAPTNTPATISEERPGARRHDIQLPWCPEHLQLLGHP